MGDAVGPFVPPWFKTPPDNPSSRYLASVFWGITIAIGIYSTIRSGHLTWRTWKRGHRVTPYVIMICI
ncbi:hypothetical protein M426DRAFT_326306 [Hypoxylon sp. CI-4A]|nr:hypothetical protein M426DRAFT_326306 [Hypoxylon sp. CI-4A]